MKKLPELYKNSNMNPKNTNKTIYYLNKDEIRNSNNNVEEELENIFNGLGYSYNIPVEIQTVTDKILTSLVTKTKENVLTIDNQIIPIKDIIKIIRK